MARKYVKEKKIIVKSLGTLDILGGVTGPILKPFIRDTKTILHLVNTGKEVFEILPDGTEIKLTIRNYEIDNLGLMNKEEKNISTPINVVKESNKVDAVNVTENKTIYENQNNNDGNKNNNKKK